MRSSHARELRRAQVDRDDFARVEREQRERVVAGGRDRQQRVRPRATGASARSSTSASSQTLA